MNPTIRTVLFAGLAVVSLGIAWATHSMNEPVDLAEFSDVGSEFYPEFKDPNQATGLQVASYNSKTGKTDVFKVESRNGLWTIPSHHNYPADGKERLAKTAASMIGVVRKALVERSRSAHKRYDVLDPLDSSVTGTEGRGDRITLYNGDQKIVDLIVGKPLEGESGVYYVRQPERDQVYTADLGQVDISTKFADWIDDNLLEASQAEVNRLIITRNRVNPATGQPVQEELIDLTRSDNNEWQLAGLDPTKEKLKSGEVTSTISALSSLKIVGVRKKPADLIAALNGEGDGVRQSSLIEMEEKGFAIWRGGIFASEGNLELGTSKGIRYGLRFGQEFSGSDVDIEVGKTAKEESSEATAKEADAKSDDKADQPEDEKADELAKSRYVMITATFDPELLGPAPQPPVKPEPPKEEKSEEKPAEEKKEPADEDKPDDSTAAADAKPAEPAKESYEDALKEYELAKEVYEIQKKQYDADIKAGQKRVDELNRRFADWYYVISEADFERVRLKRAALVETVEPPMTPESETKASEGPAAGTKPAEPKPEEKPAAEKETGEEKPAAEKPAAESSTDEKPAAEDKPAAEPTSEGKPAAEEAKPSTESPAEESAEPTSEEKPE